MSRLTFLANEHVCSQCPSLVSIFSIEMLTSVKRNIQIKATCVAKSNEEKCLVNKARAAKWKAKSKDSGESLANTKCIEDEPPFPPDPLNK